MPRVMLHRYVYTDPDQYYKRRVRDIKPVAIGLLMGKFVKYGKLHYCIKSTDNLVDEWYEVQAGFPLIKTYEADLPPAPDDSRADLASFAAGWIGERTE